MLCGLLDWGRKVQVLEIEGPVWQWSGLGKGLWRSRREVARKRRLLLLLPVLGSAGSGSLESFELGVERTSVGG